MLHESALRALRDRPWDALRIPYWLSQGKALLKQRLAQGGGFDASSLPYAPDLLAWLKDQKAQGRQLILCTASDMSIATAIAAHLDIFDDVMASDGVVNLAGHHKAEALEQRFGRAGFDYAGNSRADLATRAAAQCEVERVFAAPAAGLGTWRRVLRVHQWMKNLLLFVPLMAAHLLTEVDTLLVLGIAFVAFSLCASSVYIANDLLDLESDRQHPRKCTRPFASGVVPAWMGVALAPLLLVASIVLASVVGTGFLACMVVYFLLTCVYSWTLKRLVLVDCLTLAVLYTLRIIAGAAAAGIALSFWLLAFSVFLFLSLAFVKRYAELQLQIATGKEKVHGRGYLTSDAPLIQTLGITSGYASVVVLALYLNSTAVLQLYRTPELVWGAVPVMLFWISWIWLKAHRGDMHDDPLVFAVKDKVSLMAGVLFALVLAGGAMGWPW